MAVIPLPIVVVLVSMLIPSEFDFNVGSLRLNCLRLALILLLPAAIARIHSDRDLRVRSFDFCLIAAFLYYAFAAFMKEAPERALVRGGIIFLETAGVYVMARAYIRTQDHFRATAKFLFWAVAALGALAVLETFLLNHFPKNLAASVTGKPSWPPVETRLGLLRAMVVFEHPIHYGAFCAAIFPLIWFTERGALKRLARCAVVAGAAGLALSAGPLQAVAMVLGGIVWERTTRGLPHRAWLTIIFIALIYLFLSLVTNRSPIKIIITSLIFESGSAWYRLLIWEYGIANVIDNPWLGLPQGFWARPDWMPADSLDHYWLALGLWGGLPSLGLYVLSIVGLLRAVNCGEHAAEPLDRRGCRYAWTAGVLALCVMGGTVHFWAAVGAYFTFCLGMGAWLSEQGQSSRARLGGALSDEDRHPIGYGLRPQQSW